MYFTFYFLILNSFGMCAWGKEGYVKHLMSFPTQNGKRIVNIHPIEYVYPLPSDFELYIFYSRMFMYVKNVYIIVVIYICIYTHIYLCMCTCVCVYTHLLLLSRFSRVRLCATPETAAHQAPPSLGFSRQEHWSRLPFPSPIHESEKWKWSRSVASYS